MAKVIEYIIFKKVHDSIKDLIETSMGQMLKIIQTDDIET
jgi:hypothetical protein